MAEHRRQSGRRDRQGSSGVDSAPKRGGRKGGRKRAENEGERENNVAKKTDDRNGNGGARRHDNREEPMRRRRPKPQDQPPHRADDTTPRVTNGKSTRRKSMTKKDIQSSVQAAIDVLDAFNFKSAHKSSSSSRIKGKTSSPATVTSGATKSSTDTSSTRAVARKQPTKPKPNSRQSGRAIKHTKIVDTTKRVVDSIPIPPRLQSELQTRRRQALDINCFHNEDGTVECDVPNLVTVDPTAVYNCQFSPSTNIAQSVSHDMESVAGSDISEKGTFEEAGSKLGKNGWHRALRTIAPPQDNNTFDDILSQPSLDQMTVSHLLEIVYPQVDEYNAIEEEYEYLLKEIKALENDRVQLEQQFHEVGRVISQKKLKEELKEAKKLTYQTFRTNFRYMKSDDLKPLPLMWLEDVPLSSPDRAAADKDGNKLYAKLDRPFQDLIRNHRGGGLALLIADPQCKASLIGQCYINSHYGIDRYKSSSAMLKREKAATLIDEGGESLKHCAITGFAHATTASYDDSGETSYFLKFDGGKARHKGNLPSNLVARLSREEKSRGSINYLSTGCSYSARGGHRCYYAEFDNGECWWGCNKDDVLDKIFNEMDVHRVAFGSGKGTPTDQSSWVVIGKDGSVRWRNVPQGLHDVLIARDSGASASTTDDVTTVKNNPSAAAAPCEVSLGVGGTYFVRFLDGRVDYSLPTFAADAFDKLEAEGKLIRNVALHVDTYDCLVRYSKGSDDDEDM